MEVRKHKLLLGFMDEAEAILTQRYFSETKEPDDALRAVWQPLAEEAAKLGPVSFDVDPQPLSTEAQVAADAIAQEEIFQQIFGAVPPAFSSVRIDGLLAAQKHVDAGFGDALDEQLADANDEAEVLRFCMRANPIESPIVGPDGLVTFSSHYAQNLQATPMRIEEVGPTEFRIYASVVSRPNYLQVVPLMTGRYVLANGYHRAVALRRKGVERLPCVMLQPVPSLMALQFYPPAMFSDQHMMFPRPPMVADFLNDKVTATLGRRGRNHIVRVGLQVQAFEAPR